MENPKILTKSNMPRKVNIYNGKIGLNDIRPQML
jgi:hypothetical protein